MSTELKSLKKITPTEFENLTFDLLLKLGMKNCVWRTPGSDSGRDIYGECFVEDISGYFQQQNWYVECKRYNKSVDWPTVWEKLSYADSNSADVLLFVTSSSLSPKAVDEVAKWNDKKKRLSVRFWNGVDFESKIRTFPDLMIKYGLSENPSKDQALALFPIVKILLKYSDAMHSAYIFNTSDLVRKLAVVHALSELITKRSSDFEKENKTITHQYREKTDGYEWLLGGCHVEKYKLDRYAYRALVSYVRDFEKQDELVVSDINNQLRIKLKDLIPDYVVNDLIDIALLSNIRLFTNQKELVLEPA